MPEIKIPKYLKEVVPFVEKAYPQKADAIMDSALSRYRELVLENIDEPKAYHMHTRERIYPSIAMFDSLLKSGVSRKDAEEFVCYYYAWRSQKMAKLVKRISKFPGLYKKMPSIFTSMTKKMFGEDSGFVAKYYDVPKSEMRIDMLSCPYNNICIRYGCPEIVKGFCNSDDICYADMHPKLLWQRTKTLGRGGDCCDFKISIKK